MLPEIPALKFKFDAHALPSIGSHLPLGLAVGKSMLRRFDDVAQILRQHPKEQHYALLVDRFMPHPAKVHGIAVCGAVSQRRMPRRQRLLVWRPSRQQRYHIRPFPLAFREFPERLRHSRPSSESFLDRARVVFPRNQVRAPRKQPTLLSHHLGPVFQQVVVRWPHIHSARLEPRRLDRLIPSREMPQDGMFGDPCARDELHERRCPLHPLRKHENRIYDLFPG